MTETPGPAPRRKVPELTLDQRVQVAETNIARVLNCTPVPTLMHEVREYAFLRWQQGYDRGYEDGCDD